MLSDEAKIITKNGVNSSRIKSDRDLKKVPPGRQGQKTTAKSVSKSTDWFAKHTGTRSLFIFPENNVIRRFAASAVEWQPFEYMILLTIIANCIVLALDEHLPNGDRTPTSLQLDSCEPYFLSIFCVEAALKVIAYGLILHREAYLRNPWNIMDGVVVLTGLLAVFDTKFDQPVLRAIRVLRPLKLVTGVTSLQIVLKCILKAMVPLVQIGMLVSLSVVLFGIIGVEFYNGAYHAACLNNETGMYDLFENGLIFPCAMNNNTLFGGLVCPSGYVCTPYWIGPYDGVQSFDNIGLAMLTVFNVITLSGWTDVMYESDDALGRAFNWMYFIPLVIIGAFFMLNLVLGVLSGEFSNEKERGENRRRFLKIRERMRAEHEFEGYTDWICKAEELILNEDQLADTEQAKIVQGSDVKNELKTRKRSYFAQFWRRQKAFRYIIRNVLKNQVLHWIIIALVFLNTTFLCFEHYHEPLWLNHFLTYEEYLFDAIFTLEMLLKMYGLGLPTYFRSSFNKFDCLVVCLSYFELTWQQFDPLTSFGFSVLRSVRLLRVFKVTRYWMALRNLIISLLNSTKSIISLLVLIFLFIVVFSLLGMQLFGGQWNFPEGRPVSNFDTFSSALLTVFQIMSLEDWNQVMYSAVRSEGGLNQSGAIFASLYFVILVIFGSYTLLNVFIAIAVDNLAEAHAMTAAELEKEKRLKKLEKVNSVQGMESTAPMAGPLTDIISTLSKTVELPEINVVSATISTSEDKNKSNDVIFHTTVSQQMITTSVEDVEGAQDSKTPLGVGAMQKGEHVHSTAIKTALQKPISPYSSLFIFSSTNPIRKFAHYCVTHPIFDKIIMVVICVSSITLAAEDPVNAVSTRNLVLNYIDYAFTAVFTVELILKIVDMGLILHPDSYLRNPWNIIDAVVVFCALLSIVLQDTNMSNNLSTMKALRVLRVLRPLRTIDKLPKLKAVFDCLIVACKNLAIVMFIYLLFLLIFAVIGVQLYEGTFYQCNDLSKNTEYDCNGEFIDYSQNPPVTTTRQWTLEQLNFDNIGAALLTLFVVQTRSGWYLVMYRSMDSVYEDHGPLPDYNDNMAIYYIVYFMVFPYFFLNIFVALLVVSYKDQTEDEVSCYDLDQNQKRCIDYVINAKPINLYMPRDRTTLQFRVWRIMMSDVFEYFIVAMIALNAVTLTMKYHDMPDVYAMVLQYFNVAFTCVFGLEALIKMFGYGPLNYFRQPWNVFDMITVIGSTVDIIITFFNINTFLSLGFLRLSRAVRLIKALRKSYSIRILLWTFGRAMKALPYVLLLIAIIFFVYAVVGMQFFGDIAKDSQNDINRHCSFASFPDALLLMFRVSTFDNWIALLLATLPGQTCDPQSYPPDTNPPPTCGSYVSIPFFVSFTFLTGFLVLNLFVAVITDSFEFLTRDGSILGPHHLDEFTRVWAQYDPAATQRVHYSRLHEMLKELLPPLGFGKKCPYRLAYRKLIRMNMPLAADGTVHFKTTLFALVRESLAIKIGPVLTMDQLDDELRHTIRQIWPSQKKLLPLLVPYKSELRTFKLTIGKIYTCRLIARNWRSASHSKSLGEVDDNRRGSSLFARLVGTVKNMSRRGSAVAIPTPTLDTELQCRHDNEQAANHSPLISMVQCSSDVHRGILTSNQDRHVQDIAHQQRLEDTSQEDAQDAAYQRLKNALESSSVKRKPYPSSRSIDKSHRNYGYTNSHGRDSPGEFDNNYDYIKNYGRDRIDVLGQPIVDELQVGSLAYYVKPRNVMHKRHQTVHRPLPLHHNVPPVTTSQRLYNEKPITSSSSGTQQRRRSLCRGQRVEDDDDVVDNSISGDHVGPLSLAVSDSDIESVRNGWEVNQNLHEHRVRNHSNSGMLTVRSVVGDMRRLPPLPVYEHQGWMEASDRYITEPRFIHDHQRRQRRLKVWNNERTPMSASNRGDRSFVSCYRNALPLTRQQKKPSRQDIRPGGEIMRDAFRDLEPRTVVERQPRRCLPIPRERGIIPVAKRSRLDLSRRILYGMRRSSLTRVLYLSDDDTEYDAAEGIAI